MNGGGNAVPIDAPAAHHLANTARNLILERELVTLHRALAGVDHLFVKGVVLTRQLYDSIGDRSMVDIDVVVRPKDLHRAVTALGSLGYAPVEGYRMLEHPDEAREVPLRRILPNGEVAIVDLHWHLFDPFKFDLSEGDLWSRTAEVPVLGEPVPTTNAELTVLYLAVHDLQHGCREVQIQEDLRRASARWREALDWSDLLHLARETGTAHVLGFELRAVGVESPVVLTWRARLCSRLVQPPRTRRRPHGRLDSVAVGLHLVLLPPRNSLRYLNFVFFPPRYIVGTTLGRPTASVRWYHYLRRLARRRPTR